MFASGWEEKKKQRRHFLNVFEDGRGTGGKGVCTTVKGSRSGRDAKVFGREDTFFVRSFSNWAFLLLFLLCLVQECPTLGTFPLLISNFNFTPYYSILSAPLFCHSCLVCVSSSHTLSLAPRRHTRFETFGTRTVRKRKRQTGWELAGREE